MVPQPQVFQKSPASSDLTGPGPGPGAGQCSDAEQVTSPVLNRPTKLPKGLFLYMPLEILVQKFIREKNKSEA
jgi:hypothetical protein